MSRVGFLGLALAEIMYSATMHRWFCRLVLGAALLCIHAELTLGSVGDRAPAFQRCLASCVTTCSRPLPMFWSCSDDCEYLCSQQLTDLALSTSRATVLGEMELEGLPIGKQVQFRGKWPFQRLAGPIKMQEPLSVVFSIGNFIEHYRGYRGLRATNHRSRTSRGRASYLRISGQIYAWFGMNAWLWSTIFHVRDLPWTERADYISAAALMLCGLWYALLRISGSYELDRSWKHCIAAAWTLSCSGGFLVHCAFLTRHERFDYGYNIRFNVAVALGTIILWSMWTAYHSSLKAPVVFNSVLRASQPRIPHAHQPILPLILLPLLASLELLDFAPIGPSGLRLLDAHALWHASTIPIVTLWYRFMVNDLGWIASTDAYRVKDASVLTSRRSG